MNDNKLNKRLIIEKPIKETKNKSIMPILIIILFISLLIVFLILEKLNYFNYLDFI